MGPESQNHPVLGRLAKGGDYPWWLSQIEVFGHRVEFSLKTDSQLSEELVYRAEIFINGLAKEELAYREQIANQIVEYDDVIMVADNLNSGQVVQKMKLEHVGFSENGDFQLSYDDRGMFGGHLITGYFDRSGQLMSSEIAG